MANFNIFDFSKLGGVSSIAKTPEQPYNYKTSESPFTTLNAPIQTGALSGQGVTQGAEPLQMTQGVVPPVISSLEGKKNISKRSNIIPQANAGEAVNLLDKYMGDTTISKQGKSKMISDLQGGKITETDANEIIANIYSKKSATAPKEELSTSRAIGEGLIGAVRAGEQIPRMLGNIGKFTGDVMAAPYEASKALFGEQAGLTSFLAPGAKQMQRAGGEAQAFGEQVTRAGMTDGGTNQLTEEQIKARKTGGDIALTSVLPVGQVAKAKTALEALKTGAKVGAISTPQFTVATEGRLPTLGEQALGTVGGAILSPAIYGAGKLLTKGAPVVAGKVAQEGVEDIGKLGYKTEKGIIGGKEVNITRPKSGIIETVTSPLRSQDTKVLVGRALTPSYAGKTPKQIVQSATKTEANATKLHELVRTGKFEGNIDTLQDTAETIVKNIDTVGERIGKAVGTLEGKTGLSNTTRSEMLNALKSKVEVDAGAYGPLKKFFERTKGQISYGDLFKIKKIYSSEIKKLIKSGDAGTDSFSALVKGVQEISDTIDNAVEKKLVGTQYANDKQYYKLLKEMVADVAKSSAVEGRRAPQTLIEQLGYLEALTSPVQAAKQLFAREIGEMNTRSGTWKQFVNILDDRAIQNAKNPKPTIIPKQKPIQSIPEAKPTQSPTIPKTIETTPTAKKTGIIAPKEIPEGYIRNTFTGKIEKINQSKKGSLNIGQIGKDLGLIKKEPSNWTELQKTKPELFETGILRKSKNPNGMKEEIPPDVFSSSINWQNYGQYDEIPAKNIYEMKSHKYFDDKGKQALDSNGYQLEDTWDSNLQEWIEPNISNSQLRDSLLESFQTEAGKKHLSKIIEALPKNKDGTINAYRIGNIGEEGAQSYTLSEGMAKTFSNQGTDIMPSGTPGIPTAGYKDFGGLKVNTVKIDPKGIRAWSPYDAEILVEPKYVINKPSTPKPKVIEGIGKKK